MAWTKKDAEALAAAFKADREQAESVKYKDYRLVQTCCACPEQYDVYKDDELVGYLRLRHGYFYADYPECGGETVYGVTTNGDGCFDSDERVQHLLAALKAIDERHTRDD